MTTAVEHPLRGDFARWEAEAFLDKWSPDQHDYLQRSLAREKGLLLSQLRKAGQLEVVKPFAADYARLGVAPDETVHIPAPANRLVTVGLNALTARLVTTAQVWDNTHAGLAVGDSSTADAIGDTDMLASTNKRYNAMDATFPSQVNGVLTFKATYGNGEGEFAWNEYGAVVANTATAFAAANTKPTNYILLNRKSPASLGTKGTNTSWAFTVTITIV